MRFLSVVELVLVIAAVQATAKNFCLTPEPPSKLVAAHRMLGAQESTSGARVMSRDTTSSLNVDLYMHVVESEETKGHVTDDAVKKQVDIIVDTFSKYNIMFHYKGVDSTVNDAWATTQNDTLGRGLALRKGDYLALNVYIVTLLDEGGLGVCTFPYKSDQIPGVPSEAGGDETSDDGLNFVPKDGCTIGGYTLPGQNHDGEAMEGLTAVHEIGHWLGLFHTFQGDDCTGPGDLIEDTRPQANQTRGCPAHRVSCPNTLYPPTPEDPFHNFMDYSADNCTTQFTALQLVRVFGVFPLFRVLQNYNVSRGGLNSSTPGDQNSSTTGSLNSSTPGSVQTIPPLSVTGTVMSGDTGGSTTPRSGASALLLLLICYIGACGKQG